MRASRSARPPSGSISSPAAIAGPSSVAGLAIAFTVKSRWLRSSSMVSPWSGAKSRTWSSRLSITLHAPNAPESRNTGPPSSFATARATRSGSAVTAMSTSCTGRPSSSSRTAPPTIQASVTACAPGHPSPHVLAPHPREEAGGDLVVDGPEPARHLLGQDALLPLAADQHHRIPHLHVRVRPQRHRHVVHADGADERMAASADQYVAVVRQPAPPAVAVADRHGGDPV